MENVFAKSSICGLAYMEIFLSVIILLIKFEDIE